MSRNGIWYFNYRIPTAVRKRHGITSQFIRKSLRTSNTRQAVLLSKEYISMLMGDNSLMTDPEILKQLNINFNQPSTSEKQANDSVLTDCTCFGVNDCDNVFT